MKMRLAVAGVGNNISALVQGLGYYSTERGKPLPGVARPSLAGIRVTDVDVVAAFDVAPGKVGCPLSEAVLASPNNYPLLGAPALDPDPSVSMGISDPTDAEQLRTVSTVLKQRHVEVLLYSLPTGLPNMARAYAEAALAAGVAVVNCTPDPVAGLPDLLQAARASGIPLLGDDLQSHFGSSVVHGALLALFESRGVELNGSYQLNCGGNADFANLRQRSQGKESSKHNALRQKVRNTSHVTVVPSAAFVPHLEDRKVGIMAFEGRGWANMPIRLDVTLQVQDSSNAAGVIIDLIRIAAVARRRGEGGFPVAATTLLKSPPALEELQRQVEHGRELLTALADEKCDVPDPIDLEVLARAKGLSPAALREFGVHDRPGGGVRIEYVAPDGTPARARLRMALGGLSGSAWEEGELPITAYWRPLASDLARRREMLLVCEGESSCWTAWHGGFGAVGIPGADQVAALRAEHLASVPAVAVVLEPEDAQTYPRGRARYLAEVRERLRAIGYVGRIATLDLDGVAADINSLYQAAPSAFAAKLEELIQLARHDG